MRGLRLGLMLYAAYWVVLMISVVIISLIFHIWPPAWGYGEMGGVGLLIIPAGWMLL